MKLIIEIPEDDYNNKTLVKYFGCYSEKLDEVIYSGESFDIEALSYFKTVEQASHISGSSIRSYVEDIKKMLDSEPQPKRGKWITTNDYVTTAYGSLDYYRCSCCGEDSLEDGNYCPNCGADMRGDADE